MSTPGGAVFVEASLTLAGAPSSDTAAVVRVDAADVASRAASTGGATSTGAREMTAAERARGGAEARDPASKFAYVYTGRHDGGELLPKRTTEGASAAYSSLDAALQVRCRALPRQAPPPRSALPSSVWLWLTVHPLHLRSVLRFAALVCRRLPMLQEAKAAMDDRIRMIMEASAHGGAGSSRGAVRAAGDDDEDPDSADDAALYLEEDSEDEGAAAVAPKANSGRKGKRKGANGGAGDAKTA